MKTTSQVRPGWWSSVKPEPNTPQRIAVSPDTVVIAREELERLLNQEAETDRAYAFGLLLGGGFLDTVVAKKAPD